MLRKKTTLLVGHVTATPPSMDIGVREVRAMHLALGWRDTGYQTIIRRNGIIEFGRPMDEVGAHVAGFNSIAVGVALVGGVDARGRAENNATDAQMYALEAHLFELSDRFPDAKVCGHRDLSPDADLNGIITRSEWVKECPCFDIIPWAASKGLRPADIRGEWTIAAPLPNMKPVPIGPDTRDAYLQRLLLRAGYQFGPVDGIVGPRTRAAIRAFQIWAGLTVDGNFDVPTVARLRGLFE
ncbi:peptidoglycan recognition protein family protein [Aliihoeflea sp. PC F10.4]